MFPQSGHSISFVESAPHPTRHNSTKAIHKYGKRFIVPPCKRGLHRPYPAGSILPCREYVIHRQEPGTGYRVPHYPIVTTSTRVSANGPRHTPIVASCSSSTRCRSTRVKSGDDPPLRGLHRPSATHHPCRTQCGTAADALSQWVCTSQKVLAIR